MRRLYVSLLATVALAAAALVAPAISSAASCPPGQEGTAPYCKPTPPPPPPPPPVTTVSVGNETTGTVQVTFSVPGPGTLTVNGKAIKGLTITVDAQGNVQVKMKAIGKVLQHLNNRGWTRRKQIYATFTATDGTVSKVKIVVRFRKPTS